MCRFLVYKGTEPIQLSHLVTKPKHSIINQAFESKLRFPSARPMNADGFGIGWYDPISHNAAGIVSVDASRSASELNFPPETEEEEAGGAMDLEGHAIDPDETDPVEDRRKEDVARAERRKLEAEEESQRPCLFKSISPAWSNANLTRLAEKIRSSLVFAHVRASTMPGAPNEDNCHPWCFDKLMWMHNGEISDFTKIKRSLQALLPEELFLFPQGYTDSEWAFALYLSFLKDPHARSFTHQELRSAMVKTIETINKLSKAAGIKGKHLLNYVVTDGESVVATRYISSRTDEASSLFFSSGTSFDEYQDGGLYRMTKADKRENIIMIASEPLTFERSDWMEVKSNNMIVITPKMNVLQIPIVDEFYVAPQDPASHQRSTDFAISAGFGAGLSPMLENAFAAA